MNDPALQPETRTADPDDSGKRGSPLRQMVLTCLAVVAGVLVVAAAVWVEQGLNVAREALEAGENARARGAVGRYLWFHSGDSRARMVAAKAYVQDDRLPAEVSAQAAVAHLQHIDDDAPNAAEARMLEGRLTFLILCRPARAERLFRRALELDPDQFDSNYLLWKLMDMTERYFYSEPSFRATFRLVSEEERPHRLREWYLSQFNPLSACAEIDGLMGFRGPTEPASEQVAYRRLSTFLEREPDSPITAAAMAQWHLRNRRRDAALEVLQGIPDYASVNEPFFVGTLAEVLLALGKTKQAATVFENWTTATTGYQYWRVAGIIEQEVFSDFAKAVECYDRALAIWPGPSDWLTMHRRFRCLAVLGRGEAAADARRRSEQVESLMELELHQRLKRALLDLRDPSGLAELVTFYGSLDRPWEKQAWQAVIDRLQSSSRLETD